MNAIAALVHDQGLNRTGVVEELCLAINGDDYSAGVAMIAT